MYAEKKEWMREYADREPAEQKAIADAYVTNRFIMHSIIAELDNIRCYVDIEKFEKAVRNECRKIPVEYVFSDHVYYKREQIIDSLGIRADLEAKRKRLETFCWLEEVRYE